MRHADFATVDDPEPDDGIEPIDLICCDCGAEFRWTSGEQRFFRDRGLENVPKRCRPCREARRAGRGR
jgi:hypothetical protein